jgi:hypothetical protein
MPLSLEHSALVIAANVPELERRFRRLADEISLVASHLADTEPELAQLTKLRDEIAFAAENLRDRSESAEVQAAAAALSSACNELTCVLFQFRRHHDGSLSVEDEPHELGRDLINDLSDEIGEDWTAVVQRTNQSVDEIFEKLRSSAARIKASAPAALAPFYDLDHFLATAANFVAALDHKARFDKVQQDVIPKYRALFEKCCEAYPRLTQHFAESFDDERFSSEMIAHRRLVRDALKDIEIHQNPGHTLQASSENFLVVQRHPYVGRNSPGHPRGWHDLVKDDVTLYGRRLKLQNKPARLLMRLLLSKKRLSIEDLSCVDASWQDDLNNNDDEIQARGDNNIRTALSRLRKALREQLGIPKDRQKEIISEEDMDPTIWELNWDLLDEYGLAKGEGTQE